MTLSFRSFLRTASPNLCPFYDTMRSLLNCSLLLVCTQGLAQVGWTTLDIPSSVRYDDIHFINDSVGWAAGGPAGTIYRTEDRGDSWALQFTSSNFLRSIEFLDEQNGFSGSLNGQLYRTTNGGETWEDVAENIDPQPEGICGLSAPDATTIYGCGIWSGPAFVIKSVNGGNDWTYIDMSAYASRLVDIHFTTPLIGFVTGTAAETSEGGIVLYTDDGGTTWTPKFTTNTISDIIWKIQRLDAMTWYGSVFSEPVNDDTRMLRSTDGGMTWTMSTVADTYTYVEVIGFINPMHGWTGGHDQLWETTDGGETWAEVEVGFNYNRFFKTNDSTAYISGQRLYRYRGEVPQTGITEREQHTIAHDLTVMPNPSDGKFTIRLDLDLPTMVDLVVLAPNGATLARPMHRKAGKGTYTFPIDLGTAKGSGYVVMVRTNEGMQYRKVLLE